MSTVGSAAVAETSPLRLLSVGDQIALSCLWFAFNVEWGALLPIVWPAQVAAVAGPDHKELLNGIAIGLGALVSLIVAPVAGAVSDHTVSDRGRRQPHLVAGTVVNLAALLFLARLDRQTTFWLFVLGVIGVQAGANWWAGAYAGLIPDLVRPEERGRASGYMMLMTLMGTVFGAMASAQLLAFGYGPTYGLIAAVLIVALGFTLWRVHERPSRPPPRGVDWGTVLRTFWVDPRRHANFYWVLATRGFITMGIFAVYTYLEYYVGDILRVAKPLVFSSTLLGIGAAIGVPAALASGAASDRYGRKRVVYLSGALMATSAMVYALIALHPLLWVTVVLAVLFGAGNSAYQAVDWALAIDVLPGLEDAGKDMGIWHISFVLPQVIAPPLTGIILSGFKVVSLPVAYAAVFLSSALWFAFGTVFVARIRGVR